MINKSILMSLNEKPYNEILNGTKVFEFRKQYINDNSIAFIYVSKTKKEICAKINFDKPIIDTSENISLLADKINPGKFSSVKDYLGNKNGFAIPINSISLLETPISLSELKQSFNEFVVPQSYYFLDKKPELLEYLMSRRIKKTIHFDWRKYV